MKVLITREKSQAEKTAKLLEKEGFEPVVFPTIRFEKVNFDEKAVLQADIIIFSSQNAVKFLFEELSPEKLSDKTIIATGEKTAKILEKKGLEPLIPEIYSAEGVYQLLSKIPDLKNKKIAVIRPVEGVNTLFELMQNKTDIYPVPVYKTVENIPENLKEVKNLLSGGKIDVVVFTSPSTFKNFIKIIDKSLLRNTKIAAIGTTTQKALEKEGITPDIIPSKFTMEELIKNIKQQLF